MGTIGVVFAIVGLLLQVSLLCVIWRRRLFCAFPFFAVYILSAVIIEVLKFGFIRDYPAYFKVFWGGEIVYAVLSLLALREVFNRLFEPFFRIYRWFRYLFPLAVLICAGIPVLYAIGRPPREATPVISFILSLELGVNLLQSGLFLIFLAIKHLLNVSSRTYSWGIVEGFAATALAGLMYAARSEFGTTFDFLVKYGPPVAYIVALILWLDTFFRVKRDSQWGLPVSPAQLAAEVAEYTKVLRRLLERRR